MVEPSSVLGNSFVRVLQKVLSKVNKNCTIIFGQNIISIQSLYDWVSYSANFLIVWEQEDFDQ